MKTLKTPSFLSRLLKPATTTLVALGLLVTPISVFAQEMSPASSTASSASATELSGTLANSSTRHFLGLVPAERDAEITLTLTFGPQSDSRIANQVNFWVLTPEALRESEVSSVRYGDVALTGGNPLPNKSDDYKVQAKFKVFGSATHTVIIYNRAGVSVDYTLTVDNATLVDSSGQTQSAVMASETMMADSVAESMTSESMTSESMMASSESMSSEAVFDSKNVGGTLDVRGQQDYYTIVPTDNDEEITLTFDYDPKDNDQLNGQIMFFVFDANGLRQLQDGVRPELANLGAGSPVKSGESKMQATFRAVGKQSYTVLVTNKSSVVATYTLSVSGGDFQ